MKNIAAWPKCRERQLCRIIVVNNSDGNAIFGIVLVKQAFHTSCQCRNIEAIKWHDDTDRWHLSLTTSTRHDANSERTNNW